MRYLLQFCDSIDAALTEVDDSTRPSPSTSSPSPSLAPLILVHAGVYRNDLLVVDRDVTIMGAAPGNVQDHVILERDNESTVRFTSGSGQAYLGYVTIKVCIILTKIHDKVFSRNYGIFRVFFFSLYRILV